MQNPLNWYNKSNSLQLLKQPGLSFDCVCFGIHIFRILTPSIFFWAEISHKRYHVRTSANHEFPDGVETILVIEITLFPQSDNLTSSNFRPFPEFNFLYCNSYTWSTSGLSSLSYYPWPKSTLSFLANTIAHITKKLVLMNWSNNLRVHYIRLCNELISNFLTNLLTEKWITGVRNLRLKCRSEHLPWFQNLPFYRSDSVQGSDYSATQI